MSEMHPLLARRSSGILLHISSLTGPWLCGDIGPAAHRFAGELAAMGQRWWQMLPLNPVGVGNSPYMTISSFAAEPRYISLEFLVRDGFLTDDDLPERSARQDGAVPYAKAGRLREGALRKAVASSAGQKLMKSAAFRAFREREQFWLSDYSLFRALRDQFREDDWTSWPEALARRNSEALAAAREALVDEVNYHEFCQYVFARQWRELRGVCRRHKVALMGDLPIFVAHGSADVWAHPELFMLDASLRPRCVAGAPPDSFNADGQRWGNALYDWGVMERDGFAWWVERIRHLLKRFDAARLDHFIGYYNFWQIPADEPTAKGGRWAKARGEAFFSSLWEQLGPLPLIAEDLGKVKAPVRALRDKYGLFGMRVLQFAFDGDEESVVHRPHNYTVESVVYTGTHDNDTAVGWLRRLKRGARQGDGLLGPMYQRASGYLGPAAEGVHWQMIRYALFSKANIAIVPVQDLLGLGSAGRMNSPGMARGCWRWRMPVDGLGEKEVATMGEITALADR